MYKNLRGAFMHAVRHPFRTTKRLANAFAWAGLAIVTECGMISGATIAFKTNDVSQDIESYAKEHNLPSVIHEGSRNIRVYNGSLASYFHLAGHTASKTADGLINQLQINDKNSNSQTLTKAALSAIVYPGTLYLAAKDYDSHHAYNAFAIPRQDDSTTCFIRPPYSYSSAGMASALTHVSPLVLRDFKIPDEVVHAYIMGHEVAHCGQSLDMDPAIQSEPNDLESLADIEIIEKLEREYPQYEMPKLLMYMRAMGTFSNPNFPRASHATALLIDARLRGEDLPAREDIYHANSQLKEMIYKRVKERNADALFYEPGYISAYKVMTEILNEDKEYRAPLVTRAAELYIEAAHYLAPSVFGAHKNSLPRYIIPIIQIAPGNV